MPLQSDFSVSPYFDDFDEEKDFYKILFRPGVSVQARELNQLQTILQKQIERFGDNIFRTGTIIDGCDITTHSSFPYVKIKDVETDGTPVNVSSYDGYYVKNQANVSPLIASIITTDVGYESQSPDLNTLYVRYLNSGYSNVAGIETEQTTFSANDTLTVYNPRSVIESIEISSSSSGFNNVDTVVITSAIAIQNSTGGTYFANGYYVGDYITDGTANVQIVSVDTTSNSTSVILRISPKAADLKSGNSTAWTLTTNTNIQSLNASPSSVANVVGIVGSGATATLVTGALGELTTIAITNKGDGYYVSPVVKISSTDATTGQITAANLIPKTYLSSVQVANSLMTPIGVGYAVSVNEGIIYQKGYFSRVSNNLVVASKYSNTPDQLSVGFYTEESVVTSNQDTSLLDNATGSPNYAAPGANRLSLAPTLVVKAKAEADANSTFFPIVEFAEGKAYKQNRQTVYNVIGNEMARRTYEESGNYVLDQFILNTKSPSTLLNESTKFDIYVDPGKAYIQGHRVETEYAYETGVNKGIDTVVVNNATISLNYGNFIKVSELAGLFMFKTGDLISLYSTAKDFITGGGTGTISTSGLGTLLGTARMRSLILDSGVPGTASAIYKLYIFDVRMLTGKNFSSVRSVYYDGTNKGIADIVLDNGRALIYDNNNSGLLNYAGNPAIKNANNISYTYRTMANNFTLAANGTISWTVTGGETFPYTGTLSSGQEEDLLIVPLANVEFSANIAGGVSCNATSLQVNGTSTTFTSSLLAGDFVKIANSTASIVSQIASVVNNTVLMLNTIPSSPITGNAVVYFPQNIPISIASSSRTANVDSNANTFYVSLGASVNVATTVAVAYNVKSSNTTPINKNVHRNEYIRLDLSNNAANTVGPWALGITDVFRLKGAYLGSNNTFLSSDTGIIDVTNDFYIDHNQNEDYYGISYLYKNPKSSRTLANTNSILIKLDYFADSGTGLKGPGQSGSYAIDDTVSLSSSTSTINTLEIPEVFGNKGTYFDLRDQFDFRPQSANTVAANANAALAPINPTEPSNSNRFNTADKKFPAPDSTMTCNVEYYRGRIDRVTVDAQGRINVIEGTPGSNVVPQKPSDALTINLLNIPAYPSVPLHLSSNTINFIDTKVANEKYLNKRLSTYKITTTIDANNRYLTQPKGYTMEDIGSLEKRIEALEYYTSYTLQESMTAKKVIPSSANVNIDRYKFGFFVDSFDDYKYSDRLNPGYSASVVDGYLSPRAEEIVIGSSGNTGVTTLPYNEIRYVHQPNATTSNTASSNTAASQSIIKAKQGYKTFATADDGSVYEEFYYTFSKTAGPVKIFVSCPGCSAALEVAQSTTDNGTYTVTQSSSTAVPIVTADAQENALWGLSGGLLGVDVGSLTKYGGSPYGGFVTKSFKLSFTYNPANGKYVRIRVYKGSLISTLTPNEGNQYEYLMLFPTDAGDYPTAKPFIKGATITTPTQTLYMGNTKLLNRMVPSYTSAFPIGSTTPYLNGNGTTSVIAEQDLHFEVTGLKPLSNHIVYLNDVDVSNICKPEDGLLGDSIRTDANGIAKFAMLYGTDLNTVTDVQRQAADLLKSASKLTLNVISTDGTSASRSWLTPSKYILQN